MNVALVPVALVAGVLAFSTPCCLPMIPGFLSFVSGVAEDADPGRARAAALRAAMLFTAGFAVMFTALGLSAGLAGSMLLRHVPGLLRAMGIVIILLGIKMTLAIPTTRRRRTRASHGAGGAFLLGAAFGSGFIPAVGPALATVLAVSGDPATAVWGGVLLVVFSIGFGLPYIALAAGFHKLYRSVGWLQRRRRVVEGLGGMMLVGIGVLFLTGTWNTIFIPLYRELARLGWPPI